MLRLNAALLALSLVASVPLSQALGQSYSTLKGIRTMEVVVAPVSAEGEKTGVSRDRLRTLAEMKLRLARITVVPESNGRVRLPFLLVNVTVLFDEEHGLSSYAINISLRRSTTQNGVAAQLLLWETGYVGVAGSSRMPNAVTDQLSMLLDNFVNDYLAQNPGE